MFCRLQKDFAQYKTELNVILEKEKQMTSDLTERLEDEKRQHGNTRTLLEQVHHNQTLSEIYFFYKIYPYFHFDFHNLFSAVFSFFLPLFSGFCSLITLVPHS